jgi:hypothetical protein
VQGSCDGKPWKSVGEAAMPEPWEGVGEAVMAKPIRHKRGLLVGCDAHTGGETSVGTLQGSGNH